MAKSSWAIFTPDGCVWNSEKCKAVLLPDEVFQKYFRSRYGEGGEEFEGLGAEVGEWEDCDELDTLDNLNRVLNSI